MADGTRAVRALSWQEVEEVRQRFTALNRYDPGAISGTILKCEDENFALGPDGKPDYTRREQLYCYAVSEKLYALFNLDEHGEPRVRKYSSLVLGQLRSPVAVRPTATRAPGSWTHGRDRSVRRSANKQSRSPGKTTPRWSN